MKNVFVIPMKSDRGNIVHNQYTIITDEGKYFQSYESIIAFIPDEPKDGVKLILGKYWDYSRTTSKYRHKFMPYTKDEILKMLESGEAIINEDW